MEEHPVYVFTRNGQRWGLAYVPFPRGAQAIEVWLRRPGERSEPVPSTSDWYVEVEAPIGSIVTVIPVPPDPAVPRQRWLIAEDGLEPLPAEDGL